MVAHGVEYLQIFDLLVDGTQVLGKIIVVRVPVEVPRHVAEGYSIHPGSLMAGHVGVQVGGEFGELTAVVRAVGEMHIAEHEDLVCVLPGYFRKLEINPLNDTGGAFQRIIEPGKHPVGRGFVTARDGDKDVAPFLGGFELIDAVFVRGGYLDTVGHHDIRHANSGRRNDSVDRSACIGFKTYVFNNVYVDSSE